MTASLILISLAIYLNLIYHRVTVLAHGRQYQVVTAAPTVAAVLRELNLPIGEHDQVSPSLQSPIRGDLTVSVRRAREFFVLVDGKKLSLYSVEPTVGRALASAKITVGPHDRVKPGLDQPLKPGQLVQVTRVTFATVVTKEAVPYRTVKRSTDLLELDQRQVIQAGKAGVRENTWRLTFENGVQVRRELVSSRLIQAPQDEIIGLGTRKVVRTLLASRGVTYRYYRALNMKVTAYSAGPESCGPSADGITAVGIPAERKPDRGIAAVDPRVIPLGTWLYVPGYGQALAADVGSAVKGMHVDVLMDTHEEALRWGIRYLPVYVLDREPVDFFGRR